MNRLWERHDLSWRDPAQIVSQWRDAASTDAAALHFRVYGDWWELLDSQALTVLVSREYEHLLMGLGVRDGRPAVSFMPIPHPSGIAVDRARGRVHVASTRNPNQLYEFAPVEGLEPRLDMPHEALENRPLVPVRSQFLPGCLYLHDLAMVGDVLHGNAVGENAVVKLGKEGGAERVWWPRSIERAGGPLFGRNHLQLNSIAAGPTLHESFFSASTDRVSRRRPGHRNFPVDRRGVIFSGDTREPVVRGLTRPHSARLVDGNVWVANSGYGELNVCHGPVADTVCRLPGWTRGLSFQGTIALVGTSRVIPRFRSYAPGLDVDSSVCGVHAVDTESGRILGGLEWPAGNQVFGVDWIPNDFASGFAFTRRNRKTAWSRKLFYAFSTSGRNDGP